MASNPPALPGKSAKKSTWVRYAVSQGLDAAEADKLTIPQLQERYGVATAPTVAAAPAATFSERLPSPELTTVYAPNKAFTGVGAGGVVFKDGVAQTNDQAALTYFRDQGFGLDKPPGPAEVPSTGDARDYSQPIVLGTTLRDAAVDPRPTDFLAPTNAGEADPHGPLVVSPGLHAVPPAPIRPGDVAVDDPARQDAEETALAHAVLVEGQPVPEAVAEVAAANALAESYADGPPAKSADKPSWVDYAVAQGMDRDEADALKKDILIERFGAAD